MSYVLLEQPELERVAEEFNRLHRTHVIVMYLRCKVDYEGRARSVIDYADRLFISKPDGSLLIHGAIKREPINWQPPGCVAHATVKNSELVIKSTRLSPREIIVVYSPKVYVFLAAKLEKTIFRLWASHDDMVKLIMSKPDLIEPGLKIIAKEVSTPFGKVDLLAEDSQGNLVVFEFKRAQAQLEAVSQLKRYVDWFAQEKQRRVRGILVAPDISPSARRLLQMYGLEFRQLLPPREGKPSVVLIR